MEQKHEPLPFYGENHPIEKVFDQIEEILNKMEKNKGKPIQEMPMWIVEEFNRVEKEFQRFQKVVSQTFGAPKTDDKEVRKFLRSIPEEQRPKEFDVLERARLLVQRIEILKREFNEPAPAPTLPSSPKADKPTDVKKKSDDSPMELLKKDQPVLDEDQELRATLDHRKKYGRMGGRKHWKPM